jgi:hypothetical protein
MGCSRPLTIAAGNRIEYYALHKTKQPNYEPNAKPSRCRFGRWLNLPPSFRGEEWKLLGALPTGDSALGKGGSLVYLAKGPHVE